MNVIEQANAASRAIEANLRRWGVTCLVEQWSDEVLSDETVVVRVLGVPRQQLASGEDKAFEIAQALLPAGQDLPFGISTHPPADSGMDGVFYEALIRERIRRGVYCVVDNGGEGWEVFVQDHVAPVNPQPQAA